jgi:hypothetical protein
MAGAFVKSGLRGSKAPVKGKMEAPAVRPSAPVMEAAVPVRPKAAPMLQAEKIPTPPAMTMPPVPEAPMVPWYETEQYKPTAKAEPPKRSIPDWSGPAPVPERWPQYGHVEPEAAPKVQGMIDNRMNAIYDLFSSGVGEVSGKSKRTAGIENMSYEAALGERSGFGKVNVKSAFPEMAGVKGSPKAIADAIKRDGNNKKYLEIKDRIAEQVFLENSEDIKYANEDAVYRREERKAIQGDIPGDVSFDFKDEAGFARIKNDDQPSLSFEPLSIPGTTKEQTIADLMKQVLQAPDSSISKRELLNLNKKTKSNADAETPLFNSGKKGLFE